MCHWLGSMNEAADSNQLMRPPYERTNNGNKKGKIFKNTQDTSDQILF